MTWGLRADPPLDPTPDQGRTWLREELLDPAYHRDDLLNRFLSWVDRILNGMISAASGAPPLSTFFALVVGLLLLVALIWLATRFSRTAEQRSARTAVVPDHTVSADEWRARAESALGAEEYAAALVDGFRAVAVRQVERGAIDDAPGATAHEVASALRTAHPPQAQVVDEVARQFDLVLYGDREATRDQALEVLRLDDALAGVR